MVEGHVEAELQVAGFAGGLGEKQSALQGGHDGRREGYWPGTLDCFGYDAGLVDDELATVRRAGTPFGSTGTGARPVPGIIACVKKPHCGVEGAGLAAQCDALRLVTLFAAQQSSQVRPTLYQGLVGGARVRGAGQYDGEVTAIGLIYTTLHTGEGPMFFPNSTVLAAATGRRSPEHTSDTTRGG